MIQCRDSAIIIHVSETATPNPQPDQPAPRIEANFQKVSFSDDFRRFFLRGLAAVLPTLITLLLLIKLWEILWEYLGQHIIWLIKLAGARIHGAGGIGYVKWSWDQNVPQWVQELLGVM